jgi:electron transfer flavoprotein alpha subunit
MADMVLVVAELEDGRPKKITYELLTAARQVAEEMDYEVAVAAPGEGLDGDDLASELGSRGAELLFLLDAPELATYATEPFAAALQQLIADEEPEVVLFGMTPTGRDLAPRVAAKLRAGLASDITGLSVDDGEIRVTRPIYSNSLNATVRVKRAPLLATLRPNTWAAAQASGDDAADIEEFALEALPTPRAEVVEMQASAGDRPALSDAPIVVSGGRGLQGPENFHLIEELADLLGAAIGTTRATVDAGWRPYEEQVGQTGKTVSPNLYVAIGISGSLQHLSGMRTSQYIVAINKDPDAPIFRLADYGIVADLFQVMPVLTEAIKDLD